LLNVDGAPAIIDNSAVSFLIDQAAPDATITACTNLRAGQEVIIERGPFDGLVGIIEKPPNARGRVKVLLQLLNQPTKVDVPVQFIKAGWMIQRN
jgi:transcription antitermination factor NusG